MDALTFLLPTSILPTVAAVALLVWLYLVHGDRSIPGSAVVRMAAILAALCGIGFALVTAMQSRMAPLGFIFLGAGAVVVSAGVYLLSWSLLTLWSRTGAGQRILSTEPTDRTGTWVAVTLLVLTVWQLSASLLGFPSRPEGRSFPAELARIAGWPGPPLALVVLLSGGIHARNLMARPGNSRVVAYALLGGVGLVAGRFIWLLAQMFLARYAHISIPRPPGLTPPITAPVAGLYTFIAGLVFTWGSVSLLTHLRTVGRHTGMRAGAVRSTTALVAVSMAGVFAVSQIGRALDMHRAMYGSGSGIVSPEPATEKDRENLSKLADKAVEKGDFPMLLRLIGSPNTPDSVRDRIFDGCLDRAANTPGNPIMDGCNQALRSVGQRPDLSERWLREFARRGDVPVLIAALSNPNMPSDEMQVLAAHEDHLVRTWVGQHPKAPPEALALLAADENEHVRRVAGENRNTPVKWLIQLAEDPKWNPRQGAAMNPNTPPEVLARLAEDSVWTVRMCVAGNPSLPETVRERLLDDKVDQVVQAAKRASNKGVYPCSPAGILNREPPPANMGA